MNAVNNSTKQRGRPFKPGESGNVRGRPRGSRNSVWFMNGSNVSSVTIYGNVGTSWSVQSLNAD
jgi:hypothetical protein